MSELKLEWPDGRVVLLRQLWDEGHSASRIAAMIGEGISRSAVLGKVHRLHLNGRTPSCMTPEEKKRRRVEYVAAHREQINLRARQRSWAKGSIPKTAKPWVPPPLSRTLPEVPEPRLECSCTILELTPKRCRYVMGEPKGAATLYCGEEVVEGQSYCVFHYRKTHQREPKYIGPRTFTRPKAERVIWRGADGRYR